VCFEIFFFSPFLSIQSSSSSDVKDSRSTIIITTIIIKRAAEGTATKAAMTQVGRSAPGLRAEN
jgi:hypothetical protein